MTKPLLPGSTIGIIGGGQLGMMTVREAHRMGYRTVVWDPDPACPASRIADETISAYFSDPVAADVFSSHANVITYEFEHIDVAIVNQLSAKKPVYPGPEILRISQNRIVEKFELGARNIPIAEYRTASTLEELNRALTAIGVPAVVKTARAGYDGKGQHIVRTHQEFDIADFHEGTEYVVERFVNLDCEISILVARDADGGVFHFPVTRNVHRDNILYSTHLPANLNPAIIQKAKKLADDIVASFKIVGLLCVEMFVTNSGEVLVNELAPRPHNSGHISLDAYDMSQFEALVRTITGLPMHEPRELAHGVMINLLGANLEKLNVARLHSIPGVRLHLYGKARSEERRKMGHVSIVSSSEKELGDLVAKVEALIKW